MWHSRVCWYIRAHTIPQEAATLPRNREQHTVLDGASQRAGYLAGNAPEEHLLVTDDSEG